MFHLPELVEDPHFSLLNKVSQFPSPCLTSENTLTTPHHNQHPDWRISQLECLQRWLFSICANHCHLPLLQRWQKTSLLREPFTSSVHASSFLHNCRSVVSPWPSCISKETVLRKHSPRTKTNFKSEVWPTTLESYLPYKRSIQNRKWALALSWEKFNKQLKVKWASDFTGNEDMGGKVSINTVEAA